MAPRIPLNRALSKLGALSRSQATAAILAGRVRVEGRIERRPSALVASGGRIAVDGRPVVRARWRAIAMYKPRGVMTTRHDPEGRRTVYDVVESDGRDLRAVGRLDRATSGLLLMTTDTRLADWILDPRTGIPRTYIVTARGMVTAGDAAVLVAGITDGKDRLRAEAVRVRKASHRESHVIAELREGKNKEIRRLFAAVGHEVTRLKRVQIGGISLGRLRPGEWRELTRAELRKAFPGAPID